MRNFTKDEQILKYIRCEINTNYAKHIKDSDMQGIFETRPNLSAF